MFSIKILILKIKTKMRIKYRPLNNSGFGKFSLFTCLIIILFMFVFVKGYLNKASADSLRIVTKSNYCIDLLHGNTGENAPVMLWICDKTSSQSWDEQLSTITHDDKYCLAVSNLTIQNNKTIVVQSCNNGANQVWLNSDGKLYNPDTEECISTYGGDGTQLIVKDCNSKYILTWQNQDVSGVVIGRNLDCSKGDRSYKLSCNAIAEWETWRNGSNNHVQLLNKYTDNASYEEWCADFISYIYKVSGYPFVGAYDGWDENNALNIQNYNFTIHDASSGYLPNPGDVAFFDYGNGGHTEMVISGGSHPTFIYGNSARVDPQTGNGDMRANTITRVKDKGSLIYYLSPN